MLPFHLCQPGGGASCGACCGLYNFRQHGRDAVRATLDRHTEVLRTTERTPQAFRAAAQRLKTLLPDAAFADVRVCPLLGFVDEATRTVGCLGHPGVTGGPDLRDCGVYDARTCQSFECPSFIWLTPSQARLIRAACPDWYLYGLVVTDVEFVRGCLRLLTDAAGRTIDAAEILDHPAALSAMAALFALKATSTGEGGIFGRFAPDPAGGEPSLRTIDYDLLGTRACAEDDVVLCLGEPAKSLASLTHSREQVRRLISLVVQALSAE